MSKLDWMYKSSNSVDPEEYLLGRSIDKNYEQQSTSYNEVDKDILPTSIFAGANSNVQVDVFRKKKEDPLEQIKQKEIEMRKQLLKNPVKLKKLQSMLKAKEEKRNHQDKKKKRKNKDKDIDDLLTEKYMKLINKYGAKNLFELTKSGDDSDDDRKSRKDERKRRGSSSSSSTDSSEEERSSKRRKYSSRRKEYSRSEKRKEGRGEWRDEEEDSRSRISVRNRSPRREERKVLPRRDEKSGKSRRDSTRRRSVSSSSEESDNEKEKTAVAVKHSAEGVGDYDYSSDEEKSKFRKSFGLVLPKGFESKPSKSSGSKGDAKSSVPKSTKYVRPQPTKLTEEEKQAKLKQMQEDAAKWEQTRKMKVNKYREEQKKEDAKEKKFDGEFMRKELAKATSKTVAERIKSNINNLQRSKFSMDQHFAKRT